MLDDRAAAALAGRGRPSRSISAAPQDIEWARSAGEFFILQSRPITALPEPAAETPTTWPLPYPKGLYFRASIVEQLPDPLSPLFADLIDGSVSRSLRALMSEAVGKNVIRDGDVWLPTINGYAYYYYSTSGMWRVMGKSLTAVRALARGKAHMGVAGWREYSHPRYERVIKGWSAKPLADSPAEELLGGVQGCWTPAPCTTRRCSQSFRSPPPAKSRSGRSTTGWSGATAIRPARRSSSGYDSEPIRAEKSLYDLAAWARRHPGAGRGHHVSGPAGARRVGPHGGPACRRGRGAVAAMAHALPASIWTGSAMPSTTWTSSARCRPTIRPPCWRR